MPCENFQIQNQCVLTPADNLRAKESFFSNDILLTSDAVKSILKVFGLLGNKGIVAVHDGAAYLETLDIGDAPFGVDGGEDPVTLVEATPDKIVVDVVG